VLAGLHFSDQQGVRNVMHLPARLAALSCAAAITVAAGLPASSGAHPDHNHGARHEHGGGENGPGQGRRAIKHVLLLSVDGMHQSDLRWYVRHHPDSTLAQLAHGGTTYSHAVAPIPTDSFPGMVGQVTGGNPRVTGVYYDAEYNHNLLPAGTTTCTGQKTGAEVNYFEVLAKDPLALDSGQGLPGLPNSILQLTGTPQTLIDPTKLPVDPSTCKPVYPHSYLKVNTVFNVLHDAGLHTAWSDKHVAYEILNGPSGNGIDDLFAPEINADAQNPDGTPAAGGGDYTIDNQRTMQYDSYKAQAVLNEIDGYDHSRTTQPGTPAVFGMNFQTVSTAQKLPVSNGLNGGYLPGTDTPGPLLRRALDYIDTQVGSMYSELGRRDLLRSTAIIVSAKHGQSPIDPSTLKRTDDGAIIDAINAAWAQTHPGATLVAADPGNSAAGSRDDAFPLWLNDRSQAAADFVKRYLWNHPAIANTYNAQNPAAAGPAVTLQHSGLKAIYAGEGAARYFGVPISDPRHPDIWGIVQHGVVYTGKTKKIAEHGGADPEDRHVALLVFAPSVTDHGGRTAADPVQTIQIAPTILRLLGFDPRALQAVQIEHTHVLPGFR